MSDMIDRQQAIATAVSAAINWHKLANPQYSIAYCIGEAVRQLPSAQPQIIRCKDCKHYWIHKCMDSMPIERCDLEQTFYAPEIDYCSLAERRTE